MTRKHATMTDGEGICLAFQSEHGGFDCSEAAIDRVSGALICNDGTLEGLGEGVADAAIYPTAEIFAGARLLALDRAAEGYANGRDAHAIDAAAKSVAESVRRNCIEIGGAGASMIDFAGHPFAASQWIGENFKTSISEVDARRLMQDLTLVDIARLDRSRPLIEGMGAQAHEGILAFLDGMEELRASSVDVELFDRLMTDDFNVVRTLGRDRSRELGTVTIHGRDIEISCTLADGFCATARPQAGTILTFSSRRLSWHGFQSSPLSFGGSTVSIRHDMPSARLARDFDLAALSAEAETAMRELGVPVPAALKYVKEECERVSARCDEIEAKVGAAVDALAQAPAKGMSPAAIAAAAKAAAHAGETGSADIQVHREKEVGGMSLPDLDILEVKSVSDMISVFETPADDAAKLIGEDDVAIFSPQLDLMIVTSQYDLEEPVTTSQTVILSVADAECTWPDPSEYVSDIVFECRWPSGANLVTEFQTFSDENATPSASLEYYRKRFAEGGTCRVFSEYDEAYLLDLKGKRHASRVDNQDGTPIAGKRPAADTASPADLAHRAACAARRSRVQMEDAATHLVRH